MTREFLESIGLPPLEEYLEINNELPEDVTTDIFYKEVLQRTDETVTTVFESFLGVLNDSSALSLVANLIKWVAQAIPKVRETIEARAEARGELNAE